MTTRSDVAAHKSNVRMETMTSRAARSERERPAGKSPAASPTLTLALLQKYDGALRLEEEAALPRAVTPSEKKRRSPSTKRPTLHTVTPQSQTPRARTLTAAAQSDLIQRLTDRSHTEGVRSRLEKEFDSRFSAACTFSPKLAEGWHGLGATRNSDILPPPESILATEQSGEIFMVDQPEREHRHSDKTPDKQRPSVRSESLSFHPQITKQAMKLQRGVDALRKWDAERHQRLSSAARARKQAERQRAKEEEEDALSGTYASMGSPVLLHRSYSIVRALGDRRITATEHASMVACGWAQEHHARRDEKERERQKDIKNVARAKNGRSPSRVTPRSTDEHHEIFDWWVREVRGDIAYRKNVIKQLAAPAAALAAVPVSNGSVP